VNGAAPIATLCPYCGAMAASALCGTCRRDPRGSRRICGRCQRQTPIAEKVCMHCKTPAGSEMSWKVPLIIVMFVAAIALAIALQSIR
jgi:hypothetical protein